MRTVVAAGVTDTVTLSNLTLQTTNDDRCIFTLGSGANVMHTRGINVLVSGGGPASGLKQAKHSPSPTRRAIRGLALRDGRRQQRGHRWLHLQAAGTVNISGGIIMATSAPRRWHRRRL